MREKKKSEKYLSVFITSSYAALISVSGGVSTACSKAASFPLRTVAAVFAIGGFIYLFSKLFG